MVYHTDELQKRTDAMPDGLVFWINPLFNINWHEVCNATLTLTPSLALTLTLTLILTLLLYLALILNLNLNLDV